MRVEVGCLYLCVYRCIELRHRRTNACVHHMQREWHEIYIPYNNNKNKKVERNQFTSLDFTSHSSRHFCTHTYQIPFTRWNCGNIFFFRRVSPLSMSTLLFNSINCQHRHTHTYERNTYAPYRTSSRNTKMQLIHWWYPHSNISMIRDVNVRV